LEDVQNILITGATGFVGTQILKYLDNKNVKIKVIARPNSENLFSKYQNVAEVISTEDFFLEKDEWYEKACEGIDIIIHSAWYATPGKYLDSPLNKTCYSGTINFARSAVNSRIKKFIGIGSCFEYELMTNKKIDIDQPLKPLTEYAKAKVETFNALTLLFKREEINFIWARLFYLYGEGEDRRRLIPVLREKLTNGKKVALTKGTEIRDYLDVEEAGRIISELALSDRLGPFNVCSGQGVSIREIAKNIAKDYEADHLLDFGSYRGNAQEPPYIVGMKYQV